MTPAERTYWLVVQRRVRDASPGIAAALLRAFQQLHERLTDAELTRLVAQGGDAVVRAALTEPVLDRAFLPVRDAIRQTTATGLVLEVPRLPKGGMIDGALGVRFDLLNPLVLEAVRGLETRVMATLKAEMRASVRQHVTAGLGAGVNPREVARGLRAVLGLAPNQEAAVRNYRAALESAHTAKDALGYQLRDRRFDATLKAARARGEAIPAAKVEKMAEAYRKRMVAFNAETNARTAALDSLKLGQRLAWDEARAAGIITGEVTKTWVGVKDDRERPEHLAMEGETKPIDANYSNGQQQPGDGEYNCRCVSVYRERRR